MAVEPAAPAEGALTRDQAANLIGETEGVDGQQPDDGAAEAAAEEPIPESDEPAAGAEEPAGEGEPELELQIDGDGEPEAKAQPVAAPQFWTADDKAWFAGQPPKDQERILAYERNRDTATATAIQRSAEAQRQAQAAAQQLSQVAERAQAALAVNVAPPVETQTIRGIINQATGQPMTWGEMTAETWAATEAADPALAGSLRATFEHLTRQRDAQIQGVRRAQEEAAAETHNVQLKAYVQAEQGKLAQLNPELATDQAKRNEVAKYLLADLPEGERYTADELGNIGARDMVIARKAMLYDRAVAAMKASKSTTTTQARPVPGKSVRPGAASGVAPAKRAATEAADRFAKAPTKEAAMALLNTRTG